MITELTRNMIEHVFVAVKIEFKIYIKHDQTYVLEAIKMIWFLTQNMNKTVFVAVTNNFRFVMKHEQTYYWSNQKWYRMYNMIKKVIVHPCEKNELLKI